MHPDWMTDQNTTSDVATLMRTLADITRLRLLGLLNRGEMNVSSLCDLTGLPQPTVSHHLGLLRNAALVANRRNGKQVFYSLHPKNVESLGRASLAIRIGEVELRLTPLDAQPAGSADTDASQVKAVSHANGHAHDSAPSTSHATPAM